MADTNAGEALVVDAVAAAAGRGVARLGGGRAPLVRTWIAAPSKAISTVPSVSVRYVWPAISCSRSMVEGAGWPYGLPAPAETTATRG